MFERFGYRSALYLSALIAIVHSGFFLYLLSYSSRQASRVAIYAVAAIAVFVGLWLLSKVACRVGTVFYVFSAGAVALPFLTAFKTIVMGVGLLWSVTMGALSLANALILIFSKSFAKEFEVEREKRLPYKKYLLNAFAILIVACVLIATLNDIMNLASN